MMSDQDRQEAAARSPFYIMAAVLTASLLPWFFLIGHRALNHDIFWLTTAAGRLLQGGSMTGDAYDTNPPLSLIVYMPLVLLSRIASLSLEKAVIISGFLYCLMAAGATYSLSRPLIKQTDALLLAATVIVASTIMAGSDFDQRDQILIWALLPFLFAQALITAGKPCQRALMAAVLVTGAVLIWLKPAYGLLPAAMLLHRAVTQKRWSIIYDADCMILVAASLGYGALVWFFFPDYAVTIFPDVLRFYMSGSYAATTLTAFFLALLYLAAFFLDREKERSHRLLIKALYGAAALCLIPFILQKKGFSYQLLPSLLFFWLGAAQSFKAWAQHHIKPPATLPAVLILLAVLGYGLTAKPSYPAPDALRALPLTRAVASCRQPCGFFTFFVGVRPVQLTSYYAGRESMSRFAALWFLPEMLRQAPVLTPALRQYIFDKYAGYIATDFDRYRPGLAVACPDEFDAIHYFSASPAFARAWQPYKKSGHVVVDYGDYYTEAPLGTLHPMVCDIYRRRMP